jgi:oxygen-independent coproporphyrinogen-3 oxidase
MAEIGINRLSLGVQSLRDSTLQLFQRDHSVKQALKAIELVKMRFSGSVSMDFIWVFNAPFIVKDQPKCTRKVNIGG